MSGLRLAARGMTSKGQENTVLALTPVLDNKDLTGAEISVITTYDGTCVLCHDQDPYELTGTHGNIRKMSRAQIADLVIRKSVKGSTYSTTAKFLFLDECFSLYVKRLPTDEKHKADDGKEQRSMVIWISVKNPHYGPWNACCDNMPEVLVNELRRLGKIYDLNTVYISSTNPFLVGALREHDKAGMLKLSYDFSSWGCCSCLGGIWVEKVLKAPKGSYQFVAVDTPFAGEALIDRFHKQGIKVITYDMGDRPRPGVDDFLLVNA